MTRPAPAMAPDAAQVVRVLVAEDATELRRLVCDVLGRQPDLVVVGEATNAEEAFALTESLRPDVVLLDYLLPGADADELVIGVDARARGAALVGFSGYYPEILTPAARRRLTCHVDKMCSLADVASAVQAAAPWRSLEAPRRRSGATGTRARRLPPGAATVG